ncbi:MAG: Ig-like domain-containing protein [Gemmatimonadaceae bacterium]
MRPTILISTVAALALAACGDSTPLQPPPVPLPAPTPAVASIRGTPENPTLLMGEYTRLVATAHSATGETLPNRPIAWESNEAATATVTADGLVTALAVGTATLRVMSGAVTRTVRVEISPIPARSIRLSETALRLNERDTARVLVAVLDSLGRPLSDRDVTWSSTNAAVATVSTSGAVRAVGHGTARIVARHLGLVSEATVEVLPDYGAELPYDTYHTGEPLPSLYRLDPRNASGTTTRIFHSAGTYEASVSPDGQRIAFTCISSGPAICTADITGGNVQVLTGDDRNNEDQPTWSPDGSRIAFRRWPHGATPGRFNPTDIWVMNANGTQAVNATNDQQSQHTPAWSPVPVNGVYRIAFAQDTLWMVDLASGAERAFLTNALPGVQAHARWSPNGRYIAFTSDHEPSDDLSFAPQIYTIRIDGTLLTRVTPTGNGKAHLAWRSTP